MSNEIEPGLRVALISFSTRKGAIGWLNRRGYYERVGELITVSKVVLGQQLVESASIHDRHRKEGRLW